MADGGFETNEVTNNWPEDFDVTIARDGKAHSGKYCLKFVQVTDKNKIAYEQLDSSVSAGKKYQLSLWYKARKGDTARFSIYDQNNKKHLLVEHKKDDKWPEYKKTIVIPAGCKRVNILLLAFGSGNTAWYDDVSFKEVE